MKKITGILLSLVMCITALVSCGGDSDSIYVICREASSGTRSAFVELLGIVDADGKDATINTAEPTNSTAVMMTTVAGNENAIGYISLGSLSDTVKALKLNGVEATVENVKNGTYALARPFIIANKKDGLSSAASDFADYIMSAQGQKIISDNGYITVSDNASQYTASGITGEISLVGSTSVGPVMEKLAEAYEALNPGVTVNVTQNGSGTGIQSAMEGNCDFAMSSRELKDSEKAVLDPTVIANDGIAVIVNKSNSLDNITSEQIKKIYLGEIKNWSEIG